MNTILTEFGKKLAERWLTLLVLPGLLYTGVGAGAFAVGRLESRSGPFDFARLVGEIAAQTTALNRTGVIGLAFLITVVLLASAAAGVCAQGIGSALERLWLADDWQARRRPLRNLAAWRVRARADRWGRRQAIYSALRDRARRAALAEPITGELAIAHAALARISEERPARPTWIGDKIHAVATRMDRDYHLDLATVWPHLRLVLSEDVRDEIARARDAFTQAAVLTGWGALYLPLAIWWWPAAFIAVLVMAAGWRRAHVAVSGYAQLLEAAVRLHTLTLAIAIGLRHDGPLDNRIGWAVTCYLQGKGWLYEQTKDAPPVHPDTA